MKISSHISVEKIESLMKEALPRIKEGCPEIIGMPIYQGILSLGNPEYSSRVSTMTIGMRFECSVDDKLKVTAYTNREMLLLFEQEGIEVY
jgi:hypothetical protein